MRAADMIAALDDVVDFAIACATGTRIFDLEADRKISLPLVSNLVANRLVQIGGTSFNAILRRACLK